MNDRRRLFVHAARVATMATLIVVACYALCAFALGIFVAHRFTAEADGRIHTALAHAGSLSLEPASTPSGGASSRNGDLDDAPIFYWYVPANGAVEALTVGAPRLDAGTWMPGPITRPIGATTFRLGAVRRGSGWVVAGQSVAEVGRVNSALVLPEVLFGLLLGLATLVGAFLVALRASAPLDLIRRRQAEFTADASHELRTPLSVVEAEVDLALRRRREPEEYEAVLRRIAGESRRLRRIVDDLLWLARADSGADSQSEAGVADVAVVVASCVDRFGAVATRDRVALGFAAEGQGSRMLKAPPELIDRLAGVLIDNACKYAGPEGSVSVVVHSSPSRVLLRVDDSGPGIPADARGIVFDRFHRAAAGGEGSGLGLAIADSVVRMTSGAWSVGDSPLGGARMEVSWRSIPEAGQPAHGQRETGRGDGDHPASAGEPGEAHLTRT